MLLHARAMNHRAVFGSERCVKLAFKPLTHRLRCIAGHQQPLSNAERKALRAESQRMGKKLVSVNMGKAGITERFIQGLVDALSGNELVKVKVGGGCDDDMDTIQETLTKAADCVAVHRIGYTLTLYRDKSLPRRSVEEAAAALAGLELGGAAAVEGAAGAALDGAAEEGAALHEARGSSAVGEAGEEEGEQEEEGEGQLGEGVDEEEDDSDSDDDPAAEEVEVTIGGVKKRIQKPPEFTILE